MKRILWSTVAVAGVAFVLVKSGAVDTQLHALGNFGCEVWGFGLAKDELDKGRPITGVR